MQIVPDPNCNDPAAWFFVGTGATVTGGEIRLINAIVASSSTIPAASAVAGKKYRYVVNVSTYATSPIVARMLFGGVEIYNRGGQGVFSDVITASNTSGLIIQAQLAGQWFIDSVHIHEMHARQVIREAVAALVTGLATTGANVFQSRAYNVNESELPCLLVYTANEEVEGPRSIGSPRQIVRTLELIVEGKAQVTADLDDTLDDIAEEVEVVIGADPTLGVNVVDCILTTVSYDYSSAGEKPIGSVLMRYAVTYITAENAPGTLL